MIKFTEFFGKRDIVNTLFSFVLFFNMFNPEEKGGPRSFLLVMCGVQFSYSSLGQLDCATEGLGMLFWHPAPASCSWIQLWQKREPEVTLGKAGVAQLLPGNLVRKWNLKVVSLGGQEVQSGSVTSERF